MIRDGLNYLSGFWQNQPTVVVLSGIAFVILVVVLIDAHRHRRKIQRRRQDKFPHQLDH